MRSIFIELILLGLAATAARGAVVEEFGNQFFEGKIRPLLVEQCYK
jgi:hypothetical protein